MSKSTRRKRHLPYYSSCFPLDIDGYYTKVTKTSGNLYRDGQKSIWISPYNQLIFNLPKKYAYQGTLITTLPYQINDQPQYFNYFDQTMEIRTSGEAIVIGCNINPIRFQTLQP